MNKKIYTTLAIVIISSLLFSACGKKTTKNTKVENNQEVVQKTLELKDEEKPYISLIPRADGHEIKMKLEKIPSFVEKIEYELLYTAQDSESKLEMEKGVGDTLKIEGNSIERDLLLGTASCTNGCKYKYDTGVNGGTLTLTLITKDGQAAMIETPFTLTTSADIKKDGGITLKSDSHKITGSASGSDYYIILKNLNQYSVFSSGAKNSLVGDHKTE